MTGDTIKTFLGIKRASKGGGALNVTVVVVQPQQVSDPASFQ